MDIIEKRREYEEIAQQLGKQMQTREEERDESYYALVGRRNIYMDFALGLWHITGQHNHPRDWPDLLTRRLKSEVERSARYRREVEGGVWQDDIPYQWLILARASQIDSLVQELTT